MPKIIPLLLLTFTKILSHLFYSLNFAWVGNPGENPWHRARIIVLLNHTSLFEPLFSLAMPWRFVWEFSRHGVFPAADVTLARPLAGRLIKALAPHVAPLTRKRDDSWQEFVRHLQDDSILIFIPEGRMKRPDGLDKFKQPMTVKTGIADILATLGKGRMLLAYSGGLHHVQAPGEKFPRLFKQLDLRMEVLDIGSYLQSFPPRDQDPVRFAQAVAKDLESRRDRHCHWA